MSRERGFQGNFCELVRNDWTALSGRTGGGAWGAMDG